MSQMGEITAMRERVFSAAWSAVCQAASKKDAKLPRQVKSTSTAYLCIYLNLYMMLLNYVILYYIIIYIYIYECMTAGYSSRVSSTTSSTSIRRRDPSILEDCQTI